MYLKMILVCIFLIFNNVAAKKEFFVNILSEEALQNFSVIESCTKFKGTTSVVRMVTDGEKLYILKQIIDASMIKQYALICDAVCSTVGTMCSIQVNAVSFIPYNVGNHLKIYPDRAATLHTYIRGINVKKKYFNFRQRIVAPCTIQHASNKKKYAAQEREQGLIKEIIESMSVYKIFPSIVALDTFMGNTDRTLNNILYSPDAHTFFGIDHGAAFRGSLVYFAYERIQELIMENYFNNCSQKIKKGLRIYKNTLVKLLHTIDPERIGTGLNNLMYYLAPHVSENQNIKSHIAVCYTIFKKNFEKAMLLIRLLDQVERC